MFLLRAHDPAQYGIGDERIVGLDTQESVGVRKMIAFAWL